MLKFSGTKIHCGGFNVTFFAGENIFLLVTSLVLIAKSRFVAGWIHIVGTILILMFPYKLHAFCWASLHGLPMKSVSFAVKKRHSCQCKPIPKSNWAPKKSIVSTKTNRLCDFLRKNVWPYKNLWDINMQKNPWGGIQENDLYTSSVFPKIHGVNITFLRWHDQWKTLLGPLFPPHPGRPGAAGVIVPGSGFSRRDRKFNIWDRVGFNQSKLGFYICLIINNWE